MIELPKTKYTQALGRRKKATAQVRLYPDKKLTLWVNKKSLEEYLPTEELRQIVYEPFRKVKLEDNFLVSIRAQGGGIRSQAEAARLGIARALVKLDPKLRKPLRALNFLTRDPRMKERKKPGLKKARRAAQWQKR